MQYVVGLGGSAGSVEALKTFFSYMPTDFNGVPINLPTRAHGEGYTDLNFLIPELIQKLGLRGCCRYPVRRSFAPKYRPGHHRPIWLLSRASRHLSHYRKERSLRLQWPGSRASGRKF